MLTPAALCVAARGDPKAAGSRGAGAGGRKSELALSRGAASGLAVAALGIVLACLYTEYNPVLKGRLALADAVYRLETRQFGDALPKAVAAADADGLSPEPWRLLAELRLAQWEVTGTDKDWKTFVETADTFQKLDPRHHVAWFTRGTWFLTAWKKSSRKEDLEQALAAFRKAVERYPNEALYHAELAWTLHLAGDDAESRQEAQRAYDLDQIMPHQEKKLKHRRVVDPEPEKKQATSYREETAEQTVQRLRTATAEGAP